MAKGTSGGARGGLARRVTPSSELAKIVGSEPLPRSAVVSKMWDYIRKNNLQNPLNKREIIADDKLKAVFGADRVSMFQMNKSISKHLHGSGGDRND
jgi:chromatin remodeling complex protein RSC6